MALTKDTKFSLHINEALDIRVQTSRYILEDGVIISGPEYSQKIYAKNSDISSEPLKIRQIAATAWS